MISPFLKLSSKFQHIAAIERYLLWTLYRVYRSTVVVFGGREYTAIIYSHNCNLAQRCQSSILYFNLSIIVYVHIYARYHLRTRAYTHPTVFRLWNAGRDIAIICESMTLARHQHRRSLSFVTQMYFSSSNAYSIVIYFLETHRRIRGNSWYLPSPYPSQRSACKRKDTRKGVKINFVSECQSFIVFGRLTSRISARIFRVVILNDNFEK